MRAALGAVGRPGRLGAAARQGAAHAVLLTWALVAILPVVWGVVASLKDDAEIFAAPWAPPSSARWDNYVRAWEHVRLGRLFANTAVVVGGALALTLVVGAMAAYVLARYRFRLNKPVLWLFVAGMVFPVLLAIVPLFFVVDGLGLLGTRLGLVLVLAAYGLPFTVFLLTGFFATLPASVAEAALLDGCGHAGAFFRIMLPMARPGLVAVGTFNLLGLWNAYLLPLVLNPDPERYVLAQGLAALAVTEGYRADYGALFAGLVIAMAPVLAAHLVLHRPLARGLSLAAPR
ncbi:carbohydrate ABC transporter permease [Xylanimonas ulmi]|uniref:N-acetylglucosamine ABC transporter membrane protein /chitobiose ABC transporter membrane protein n=1 Tax=Xylanimonas ulmi TaxID=228973 RepID=A0A4V2EY66_9MICO|nr:carbohydrate ABC transporter permease [Xylanibacterium ulmi]RZS61920.1 N-acetylglucosamine ABC transporter membrane protein /chitobiose ABC transporter membrane protein [Xylanibacterium ulmi]